jgi:hypothetical protein
MTIRAVPPSEWRSFVDRFSRANHARLATVHGIEHGVPVTRVPCVATESVALVKRDSGQHLSLTFGNGITLRAPRLCAVRVQETSDGAERALEVDTADGAVVRIAFHATALPEPLDGIAPGEVKVGGELVPVRRQSAPTAD